MLLSHTSPLLHSLLFLSSGTWYFRQHPLLYRPLARSRFGQRPLIQGHLAYGCFRQRPLFIAFSHIIAFGNTLFFEVFCTWPLAADRFRRHLLFAGFSYMAAFGSALHAHGFFRPTQDGSYIKNMLFSRWGLWLNRLCSALSRCCPCIKRMLLSKRGFINCPYNLSALSRWASVREEHASLKTIFRHCLETRKMCRRSWSS